MINIEVYIRDAFLFSIIFLTDFVHIVSKIPIKLQFLINGRRSLKKKEKKFYLFLMKD